MLDKPATQDDIARARTDYQDYIKITIDLERARVVIGGEYHYDAEQLLLDEGSKQDEIWGGGMDLITGSLETNAMINMRPLTNPSTEILDQEIAIQFKLLSKKYIPHYE